MLHHEVHPTLGGIVLKDPQTGVSAVLALGDNGRDQGVRATCGDGGSINRCWDYNYPASEAEMELIAIQSVLQMISSRSWIYVLKGTSLQPFHGISSVYMELRRQLKKGLTKIYHHRSAVEVGI